MGRSLGSATVSPALRASIKRWHARRGHCEVSSMRPDRVIGWLGIWRNPVMVQAVQLGFILAPRRVRVRMRKLGALRRTLGLQRVSHRSHQEGGSTRRLGIHVEEDGPNPVISENRCRMSRGDQRRLVVGRTGSRMGRTVLLLLVNVAVSGLRSG